MPSFRFETATWRWHEQSQDLYFCLTLVTLFEINYYNAFDHAKVTLKVLWVHVPQSPCTVTVLLDQEILKCPKFTITTIPKPINQWKILKVKSELKYLPVFTKQKLTYTLFSCTKRKHNLSNSCIINSHSLNYTVSYNDLEWPWVNKYNIKMYPNTVTEYIKMTFNNNGVIIERTHLNSYSESTTTLRVCAVFPETHLHRCKTRHEHTPHCDDHQQTQCTRRGLFCRVCCRRRLDDRSGHWPVAAARKTSLLGCTDYPTMAPMMAPGHDWRDTRNRTVNIWVGTWNSTAGSWHYMKTHRASHLNNQIQLWPRKLIIHPAISRWKIYLAISKIFKCWISTKVALINDQKLCSEYCSIYYRWTNCQFFSGDCHNLLCLRNWIHVKYFNWPSKTFTIDDKKQSVFLIKTDNSLV